MQKLFFIVAVSLLISTAASGQETTSASVGARADVVYGQPGQLVSVNGFRLNLYCMGSGSPTVVFDSGWEDWSPAWSTVQPQIAEWTRACSYDRAGAGFSDPGPMPRTSVRIAEELHTALHRAGIAGPYILVGHAFGGDNVRTFADLYMSEVAGLVLIDADPDDLEPKAMQEEAHRGEVRIVSQLRDCRNAIAEHKPLPALRSRPGQPQRTCAQQFFRGLPEAAWSPELNARLLEIAETKVAMYDAYLSEMEQMGRDEAYLQQHRRSFGSRPVRVLTSGNHGVGHLETKPADTPDHLKYEQETTQAQARWLGLSSNAKQIFARHSSEYIQFDEPETVINAIRDVYDEARSSSTTPRRRKPSAVSSRSTGDAFRDCLVCPEMLLIPAGEFTMGSTAEEKSWAASRGATPRSVADESPQHTVSLRSFALGKYDVTRGEYAAFVRETGHPTVEGCYDNGNPNSPRRARASWQSPGFSQTARDPVVCVSWQDAQAYVAWLNGKLRRNGPASVEGPYRLPSEAEWEYAARAGTTTRFWWGDDDGAAAAHAWYKENSGGRTHPVGLKPSNAFGLYDMAGNVWQWTQDCYAESYANAPADGSAAETASACLRVDRGGSWYYPAWLLRPATRERNPADYRDAVMGFRVAKTLP
jgi:formylglycine-generating enzyme required for sulfatase activity